MVGGEEYIWLIRSKPTYTQECQKGAMTASVESNKKGCSTLNIVFQFQRPDSLMSNLVNTVTPSIISSCVSGAILQGWEPCKPGPTFKYVYKG